eukprot:Em0001g829a
MGMGFERSNTAAGPSRQWMRPPSLPLKSGYHTAENQGTFTSGVASFQEAEHYTQLRCTVASVCLKFYDDELRATICSSFNIQLAESAPSWTQSTLLVHHGGLGIRSAVQLAPSAFLVSAAASSGLAYLILPANMQPLQLSYVDEALAAWSQGCQEQPPTDAAAHHQKTWDLVSDLGSLVQAMGAMWVGGGSGQGGSRRSGGGGTGANTVSVLLLLLLLAVWAALLLLAADASKVHYLAGESLLYMKCVPAVL